MMNKAAALKKAFVPQLVPQTRAGGSCTPQSAQDRSRAILSELLGSLTGQEIVATLREFAKGAGTPTDFEIADAFETVELGDLRIEKHAHRVLVADREVTLTSLEFRLLVTLVDRRDRVQSRGTLLNDVWGYHPSSRTRTVDTHVRRLRNKLGSARQFIHTVRGAGYRFSERRSILHGN
jgi:DNA-binding response OmpR family regulator